MNSTSIAALIKVFRTVALIVTLCTAITMATPSTSSNPTMQKIKNVLNILAGNVVYNTNLDSPAASQMLQKTCTDDQVHSIIQEIGKIV